MYVLWKHLIAVHCIVFLKTRFVIVVTTKPFLRLIDSLRSKNMIQQDFYDVKLLISSSFSGAKLHLKMLTAPHVKLLMKTHRVRGSILWFPRFRLQQYSNLVHQIDLAILREGKDYSITWMSEL